MKQKITIKYKTNKCLYAKDFIHETFKVKVLPGKFDYNEAAKIQKFLKTKYVIPNLKTGSLICEQLNKRSIFLDSCITTNFKEFGEDGNFIYVANYSTGDNFDRVKPVRNARYTVILCKSINKEKSGY